MKHLNKKLLGFALALALFASLSSRAYADKIAVWTDSITMTAAVGASIEAQISVFAVNVDTGDTLQNFQQHTVHVSLAGSSEFQLMSDSVLTFQGNGTITVQYSPTSMTVPEAVLTLVGDSNTIYVTLAGQPLSHIAPRIQVGFYDSLRLNQQMCKPFTVQNPNRDTILITQVTVASTLQSGVRWSLENVASLPIAIPAGGSLDLGDVCALLSLASYQDSEFAGNLKIIYNYVSGTDSASVMVEGWPLPINTTCVTASGGSFGTVAQGASVTDSLTLTNTTDTSVYLDSPQLTGDTHFTFDASQFPMVIPVNSSAKVGVTFQAPNPTTQDNYYATLGVTVHGTSTDGVPCNSLSASLAASVPIPPVDSITLDVPPSSNTLSITAHAEMTRHAIFIHNTGTAMLFLQELIAGSNDTIQGDSTTFWATFGSYNQSSQLLYDTLRANATIGPIIMTLNAPDTGTVNLALTLTYVTLEAKQKGALPASNSLTYTVVAHRLPPVVESVSEPNAPAPVDFTLSPNPAQGEVTIGLPDNGSSTVEVYDVLGNLVMSRVAQGTFIWNGTSNTGALANGTYIVRVSQGDHASSKRLVIVR